jgi:hypothetical protein
MVKYLLIFVIFNSIIFSQDDLNLNLKIGEEYLLYQHNEMSILQSIRGSKVRSYTEMDALTSYNVKAKTDSSFLLEIVMKDMIFMISSPHINLYYDSKEASTNENLLKKLFREMTGFKFNIELSNNGKILSSNFEEIFSPSLLSFFDSLDLPNKENTLNEMREKIMQVSPSKNLERITNFLPTKKVKPGEKWLSNGKVEFGIPIIYEREVLYESRKEDAIILESSASINTYDIAPSKIIGGITYDLTGNENYKVYLAPETKWFNQIEGETILDGSAYQINHGDTLFMHIKMNIKEYYGTKKY